MWQFMNAMENWLNVLTVLYFMTMNRNMYGFETEHLDMKHVKENKNQIILKSER